MIAGGTLCILKYCQALTITPASKITGFSGGFWVGTSPPYVLQMKKQTQRDVDATGSRSHSDTGDSSSRWKISKTLGQAGFRPSDIS